MKKNDFAEIKKIDIKAIQERIEKAQKELGDLLINKNTGKLTNLKVAKQKRRDVAQMLTVLNQKKLIESLEKKNG